MIEKKGKKTGAGRTRPLILFVVTAITLIVLASPLSAAVGGRMLIPGGVPFGVRLCHEGVTVVGLPDVRTGGTGSGSPAKDAGIRVRDIILSVDGKRVTSAADMAALIGECGGKTLDLTLRRGDGELTISVTPVLSDDGYKAGLWIRDSTAGIGTVTFIDPATGAFAGLGHGICDSDTGELVKPGRGIVVNVAISGVEKGQAGAPGELRGYFSSGKIGSLTGNTECGVFGVFAELPEGMSGDAKAIPAATSAETHDGDAEIICTSDSGTGRYKVRISGIDRSGRPVKNFVVTVTDPDLIAKTGGIVQGMSGSPIIQDGKLIGAVTHVLVNSPEMGYGIFIDNMLAAGRAA